MNGATINLLYFARVAELVGKRSEAWPVDGESTGAQLLAALGERLLATDPSIKAAFNAKLRAEPAFAADPDARLAWLYAQAGPGHPYPLRYPIAREVQ